jgi:hypothetical protein
MMRVLADRRLFTYVEIREGINKFIGENRRKTIHETAPEMRIRHGKKQCKKGIRLS